MEIREKLIHGASIMALSTAAGLTAASTYIPWKLGSSRGLGAPLFIYEGIGVYGPWHFPIWYLKFADDIPQALASGRTILAITLLLGGFAAYKVFTHGSAEFGAKEWGDRAYAKKKGLLHEDPRGIVLGIWPDGTLMCDDSDVSVAVRGASRSGKTISAVITTALSWAASFFCTDPSGEIYDATATWRSTLGPAFFLDYNHPKSARKNPWDEIRRGDQEVGDIQSLVAVLMDANGQRKQPTYWEKDGAIFYTQVIRYMLKALPPEQRNFGEMRRRVAPMQALLEAMMAYPDEDIQQAGHRFYEMNPDQKQGVEAEAGTALALWADPLIRKLTSSSEFTWSDMMAGDKPMSCYLRNTLDQADRLMPLTRMMVNQLTSLLSNVHYTPDGRKKKHKVLCLYEEFPEMRYVSALQRHLAGGAKFGFRFMLIMQAKSSVEDVYGRYTTILKNCPIQVLFPSSDYDENEEVSRLIGTGVEVKETISKPKSGGFFSGGKSGGGSKSTTTGRRRLLDAGEIRSMEDDQQFVIITPGKPMRTKKLKWFEHPIFRERGTNTRAGEVPPGQHPAFGRDPVGAATPTEPLPVAPPALQRQSGSPPVAVDDIPADAPKTSISVRFPNVLLEFLDEAGTGNRTDTLIKMVQSFRANSIAGKSLVELDIDQEMLAHIDEVRSGTGQSREEVLVEMLSAVKFVRASE